jgi:hypothetical protein
LLAPLREGAGAGDRDRRPPLLAPAPLARACAHLDARRDDDDDDDDDVLPLVLAKSPIARITDVVPIIMVRIKVKPKSADAKRSFPRAARARSHRHARETRRTPRVLDDGGDGARARASASRCAACARSREER